MLQTNATYKFNRLIYIMQIVKFMKHVYRYKFFTIYYTLSKNLSSNNFIWNI